MNEKYAKIKYECDLLWREYGITFGGSRYLASYLKKKPQAEAMRELALTKRHYIILTVIAGDKIESWSECK